MFNLLEKATKKIMTRKDCSAMQKLEDVFYAVRVYIAEDFDGDVKFHMSEMHREMIIRDEGKKMVRIQPFYNYFYDKYNHDYAKRVCDLINSTLEALSSDIDVTKISAYDKKLINMAKLVNSQQFEEAFDLDNIDKTMNDVLRLEKEEEMCK